jgi:hypothetical protein
MIQRYFLATGVLVLQRVTPVINALFSGYRLHPAPPDSNVSTSPTIPTWHEVHRALIRLTAELSIDASLDVITDLRSTLLCLATYFGSSDEPELLDLIESHRFTGDADLETLFALAGHLNDGHGLRSIKFNAGPRQGDLAYSAAHLGHQMLDLLSDVLQMIPDETRLRPLRHRMARLIIDAARVPAE